MAFLWGEVGQLLPISGAFIEGIGVVGLNTNPHQVPTLRIRGTVPPPHPTPSRSAKEHIYLYFYLYHTEIFIVMPDFRVTPKFI